LCHRDADTNSSGLLRSPIGGPARLCDELPRPSSPTPACPVSVGQVLFPPEVIVMAVRWYLRYGLSYRDVEELLAPAGMRMLRAGSSAGP
jgi:hypothetical protein